MESNGPENDDGPTVEEPALSGEFDDIEPTVEELIIEPNKIGELPSSGAEGAGSETGDLDDSKDH